MHLEYTSAIEEDARECQSLKVIVERIRDIQQLGERVAAYDELRRVHGRAPLPGNIATRRTTLPTLQSLLRMNAVEEAERNHISVPQVKRVRFTLDPNYAILTLTLHPSLHP